MKPGSGNSTLKGLLEVSKAVNSTLEVKKVLHLLVKTAVNALDIKAAAVRLLDQTRQKLELVASFGLSDRYLNKGPVLSDKSIAEAMMGKAVSIYDVASDSRATYPKEAGEEGIKSILSVPVTLKGNVIGVMRIYTGKLQDFPTTKSPSSPPWRSRRPWPWKMPACTRNSKGNTRS